MSVEIVVRRDIEETYSIRIPDDTEPRDVFESIESNPNSLWLDYNPELIDSYDLEEVVVNVTRFETE
jgi:hypothetical protein